jgi:hypothetical protein
MLPLRLLILSWPGSDPIILQLQTVLTNMVHHRLISPVFMAEICEEGVRGARDCSEFAIKLLDAIRAASSGRLAAKFHQLICFQIRHVVSSSIEDYHVVDSSSTMFVVYSQAVSFLLQALKRIFAIKSRNPASDQTEPLWIQGLPQFLLIKIARED